MSVMVFGVNHKTAPIAEREHWSLSSEEIPYLLHRIKRQSLLEEAVILSTCNRTEIYISAQSARALRIWLKQRFIKNPKQESALYCLIGEQSLQHAMRVASGADSLILGEPEIFGQVKQAYRWACEAGTVGKHLQHFFPTVFSASKSVRYNTGISQHAVSLAYLILQKVKAHYTLEKVRLLLIGSGEVIRLIAKYFSAYTLEHCIIAARNTQNAECIAQITSGISITLHDIPQHLPKVNVVISATSSQQPILKKNLIKSVAESIGTPPLLLFDLAVPRDIAPEVHRLKGVKLYNIDTLCARKQDNEQKRTEALVQAEEIIQEFSHAYHKQLQILEAAPLISEYRRGAREICESSLKKALEDIALGKNPEVVIEKFAQQLTNRILHMPTLCMRQMAYEKKSDSLNLIKKFLKVE